MGSTILLRSERLLMVQTTPEDLPFVLKAEYDPANAPFLLTWSLAQHRAALSDPDIAHLTLTEHSRDDRVGYAIVAGLTNMHNSIELRRLVIEPKGRGLGREVVRCLKRWAFHEHHAHRLWLDVKQDNARASDLYRSEGFVVEGRFRECIRTAPGRYESLLVMSMLRVEYEADEAVPSRR